MSDHFDALETRSLDARSAATAALLPQVVGAAGALAYHAGRIGEPAESITDRAALALLRVTRKSQLVADQATHPPFAGLVPASGFARVFASPGPIYEAQSDRPDPWRFARALHATGLRAGMLVHNCFAYHFTPAGFMLDLGARALGCPVFPAGPGNTDAQVRAAAHLRPVCYTGTPDYLRTLLEGADATGLDLSSLRLGHVTGGAYLPALRSFYADRGLTVVQSYGTADLGLIAYESSAREGLICDEEVLIEIVRPGTGDPVPDGEVGEVLVTSLDPRQPILRFATGDLSAVLPGISPCGRTNTRIRGWLGRADQAAKVRGLFVRPEMVADIARRVSGLGRLRLVVSGAEGRDRMELRAEGPVEARERLETTLHDVTRLRGEVVMVPFGTLPNDGRVVDDTRPPPA